MSLTSQQHAALAARDRSVSLAAGAGCGKTFVLTERFLLQLDPKANEVPSDFDELVAITFTEAAAREMRERIRRRCRERHQGAGSRDEADAWRRLLRGIDGAQISTIHAFCGRMLRRHAVEAGLDPQFQVLDAAAADLLRLEVVDDGLRALLEARDEAVLDLAARRGLARLRSDLSLLLGETHERDLERWAGCSPDELIGVWQAHYDEIAAPAAVDELRDHEAIAALGALADPLLAASDRLREQLSELAVVLRKLGRGVGDACAARELIDELDALARLRGGPRKIAVAPKDWLDGADHDRFKDAAKGARDAIGKTILGKQPPDIVTQAAACTSAELVRLTAVLAGNLRSLKRQRNQLEFDDLLAGAHRLLTDPRHATVQRDLAARTRLLLVDEFQDTDPLQVEIVQALCGERWREAGLFVVGDDKQSIYRFRGAEPEVSRTLRSGLPPAGQLSLTTNFRSQPAILEFVNAAFCEEFEAYEPLMPHRPQSTPLPAIELLWSPFADDGDGLAAAHAAAGRPTGGVQLARRREARWIARRIAGLVDSQQPLIPHASAAGASCLRPVQLGDVAILLRTLSDLPVYEEALRQQGLDYYLAGGHAFYAQQEVYDVLNLLRSVTSLVDEIALVGALRSPLFAFADETLYWLHKAHGSLNVALDAAVAGVVPPQLDAHEGAKVRRGAATLARLREIKDRVLVAELLDEALRLTGYDALLQAEFLGNRKLANLDKLREQARAIDRTSPGDVAGFVTQLAEFVARAPKEPPAATQAEGDVLRIMTIHYAKGLEFPVVVLPDLDRLPRAGDSQPTVHRLLGPVAPGEQKQHGLGWLLYRALEDRAERDERLRLFYVAATRAADMLILSSSVKDFAKPQSQAMKLLAKRFNLQTGDYVGEPLPAGVRAPLVQPILEEPTSPRASLGVEHGADLLDIVGACDVRLSEGGAMAPLPAAAARIPADRAARRRFSFSQLTGEMKLAESVDGENGQTSWGSRLVTTPVELDQDPEGRPPRREGVEVAGRALGSLVHDVLERVDFADPADVRPWCEFLAPLYFVRSPAEVAAVAADSLERFVASARGRALAAAVEVRREVEFLLPWPPQCAAAAGAVRRRYVHGYIDCLYRDAEGAWRLLDYKTNRVAAANVAATAARYELQLLAYSLACEEALGESLAECTLVLLDPGIEHAYHWNQEEQTAAIERITAMMDRQSAAGPAS
ncbi:MAG: UvrD-helicase domain-containing protein [Pirellulales bacterium]|nr:UvrD-helicase domain-containing protein [Pirellulales bacterium]